MSWHLRKLCARLYIEFHTLPLFLLWYILLVVLHISKWLPRGAGFYYQRYHTSLSLNCPKSKLHYAFTYYFKQYAGTIYHLDAVGGGVG